MAIIHALRFSRSINIACVCVAGMLAMLAPSRGSAQEGAAAPGVQPDDGSTRLRLAEADRAEFNGGRLAVEIVVSAVGGSLAAYGTYKAVCGSDPCMSGALAGAGANVVATPLLTMGTGALMGGRGTFLFTAMMGLGGFVATASIGSEHPGLALAISMGLMPILAPLGYEISSNMASREMRQTGPSPIARVQPMLVPVRLNGHVTGAVGGVTGSF